MTLDDLINADITNVILNTDDFADSVMHHPGGSGSSAVTAIVSWDDPVIDREGGQREKQTGRLRVASSVALTNKDTWTIGSVVYQTVRTRPVTDGMQIAFIQAVDFEHRSHGPASKL